MIRSWSETGISVPNQTTSTIDGAIAAIATSQHGLITRAQLIALGLSPSGVRKRVDRGRLHRVHRGVYAVGHACLSLHGRWMADVLACGPLAALSHRAAAALWRILPIVDGVEVTSPTGAGRATAAIVVHRSPLTGETTVIDGIPVTTVARTLRDLAATVPWRILERAVAEADVRRVDFTPLWGQLSTRRGHPGTRRLSTALGKASEPALTRSELEERVLVLCERERIERPAVNAAVALPDGRMLEVDFLWRERRVILEADGMAVHATARAFERDRRRDQRLAVAGYQVLRTTWRQVGERPGELADALRRLTADRGGR